MREYIDSVIRPLIQGDGGEIEFISFDGKTLRVRLRGECSFCSKAEKCIDWCEEKILRDVGESVKIIAEKKRPYFRDR